MDRKRNYIIYYILNDELIMSLIQRRIGPINTGYYGILSAIEMLQNPMVNYNRYIFISILYNSINHL